MSESIAKLQQALTQLQQQMAEQELNASWQQKRCLRKRRPAKELRAKFEQLQIEATAAAEKKKRS